MDLSFLQKNYIFVIVAILISIAVTFITNLLLTQQEENKSYVKSAIVAGLVSTLAVYIHSQNPELETILTEPAPF